MECKQLSATMHGGQTGEDALSLEDACVTQAPPSHTPFLPVSLPSVLIYLFISLSPASAARSPSLASAWTSISLWITASISAIDPAIDPAWGRRRRASRLSTSRSSTSRWQDFRRQRRHRGSTGQAQATATARPTHMHATTGRRCAVSWLQTLISILPLRFDDSCVRGCVRPFR